METQLSDDSGVQHLSGLQRLPSTGDATSFRPEIEGLRAIAATLVAVFHIWLGRVSGGVDVFFVVSGFLVTTTLVRQVERTGGVPFAQFWSRLVRRLAPAALLVLATVIVASLLLLPHSRYKETVQEIAAAATYSENWVLAFKSIDYLAKSETPSPVQHFWALSVQGQLYILWPLLVALAAYAARRSRWAFNHVLPALLGAVFVASLVCSILLTIHDQPFAYFNTFARAWEFCLGALLVFLPTRWQPQGVARVAAGWVGLAAILSCGLVFQVSKVFPGYAALWPTLGAALVILAGDSRSPVGADRLLALRPLVFMGGISYGIYLWHFPLLVFCRTVVEPGPITVPMGFGVIVFSVFLAYLTNRFLERPAQSSGIGRYRPVTIFLWAVAGLAVLCVGLAGWTLRYYQLRAVEAKHIQTGDPNYPGAGALQPGFHYAGARQVPVFPGPLAVNDDFHTFQDNCVQNDDSTVPATCATGSTTPRLTIAIVGGSHSAHWAPALERIATDNNWRLLYYTKGNCPFEVGDPTASYKFKACGEWNRNVLVEILRIRPDAVFTTSTRHSEQGEFIPQAYRRAWEALAASGIRVIAIRDNPSFDFDVSVCVERRGAGSPRCAVPRERALAPTSPASPLRGLSPLVRFLDLSDQFCGPQICPPVVGNVLLYRHGNHITSTFARSLAPAMQTALLEALGPAYAATGAAD